MIDCTQQTIDDNDDDGDVELLLVEEEKIENFFPESKSFIFKKIKITVLLLFLIVLSCNGDYLKSVCSILKVTVLCIYLKKNRQTLS